MKEAWHMQGFTNTTPLFSASSTSQTIELRKVFGKPMNLWRKRVSIA
jgi:hypothetical protein